MIGIASMRPSAGVTKKDMSGVERHKVRRTNRKRPKSAHSSWSPCTRISREEMRYNWRLLAPAASSRAPHNLARYKVYRLLLPAGECPEVVPQLGYHVGSLSVLVYLVYEHKKRNCPTHRIKLLSSKFKIQILASAGGRTLPHHDQAVCRRRMGGGRTHIRETALSVHRAKWNTHSMRPALGNIKPFRATADAGDHFARKIMFPRPSPLLSRKRHPFACFRHTYLPTLTNAHSIHTNVM